MIAEQTEVPRVGIIGTIAPSALKQKLLFFDNIGVVYLDKLPAILRAAGQAFSNEDFGYCANELEFCAEKKLIFDPGDPNEKYFLLLKSAAGRAAQVLKRAVDNPDTLDLSERRSLGRMSELLQLSLVYLEENLPRTKRNYEKIAQIDQLEPGSKQFRKALGNIINMLKKREALFQAAARVTVIRMNEFENASAVALVEEDTEVAGISRRIKQATGAQRIMEARDVVEIVLSYIPLPDDSVPWEAVLDFRSDKDAVGYLRGLRVWMNEALQQKFSRSELEDKLEWLLFQQKKAIEAHRIKSSSAMLGGVFIAGMEVLEDLVKIKWGKAAQGIVAITNRKANVLQMELDTRHPELNYIIKAQEKFGGCALRPNLGSPEAEG